MDGLVVGVSIAAIFTFYPRQRTWLQKHSYWLLAARVAVLYFAAMVIDANQTSFLSSVFGFPLVAVGFGCMVISSLSPSCFLYSPGSVVKRMIAILSYSIYLIHKIVISALQKAAGVLNINVDGTLMFFLCILCTLLAAWLLYTVVERPFLRLRERIFAEKTVKSTTTNPATAQWISSKPKAQQPNIAATDWVYRELDRAMWRAIRRASMLISRSIPVADMAKPQK
jgi:peptidoglycan/LPS O-acetylase OafA/YrhL